MATTVSRVGRRLLAVLRSRDGTGEGQKILAYERNFTALRAFPGVVDWCSNRRWSSGVPNVPVKGALEGDVADVAIVGGGIVGLAVAREIVHRFPKATIILVEKEMEIVKHQTSHNRFLVIAIETDQNKGVEVLAKNGGTVKARWLITCAGLHADYVGRLAGGAKDPIVLPFRGTYHELKPEYCNIITRNIYPVPDPKFPMVGVHLTPRVDGRVLIGPNSALALSKEGYKFWNFTIKDAVLFGLNLGLWKLLLGNPGIIFQEIWRDINTKAFVGEAQRYCPKLEVAHTTAGWAGVHAVAIDSHGKIVGNFLFDEGDDGVVLNVRNAPSPVCTASLAIASSVVDKAVKDFNWNEDKFWTVNMRR